MRDTLLKTLAKQHATHPWRMLIIVLLMTIIFSGLATQLSVTMRWSDLLPANDKRTIEYNKIVDEFVSATSIVVVVQGEESQIKSFADALAPVLLEASVETNGEKTSLIQRVDYKAETDYLRKHGLMLIKENDLKNVQGIYTDPNLAQFLSNLNDALEKEYVGNQESISSRQKEDDAVYMLDGIENFILTLSKASNGQTLDKQHIYQMADRLLLGDPYFLSYDQKALIINAIPTFTIMDMTLVVEGTATIQAKMDSLLVKYPGVEAGMTGFIPIAHDEMVYSEQSLSVTTLIAVIAIFIMLMISFRMWIAPLFAIGNLLIGIVWAIGLVALLVGQLNIMTQMMAVILIGLGIDFSIHLISGFSEFRGQKQSILHALENTFLKIGRGVITGGVTTSFAFFSMTISSSRGMKELGIVTGAGLMAILLSTFLILPVFMVFRERYKERKLKTKGIEARQKDLSFQFLGHVGQSLGNRYRYTLTGAIILTLVFFSLGSQMTFDSNYMNIEPKGLTSVVLQDTVLEKFDLSMDYALILSDSPEKSHDIADAFKDMQSVAMTEDISLYLPTVDEQNKRKPYLEAIKRTMQNTHVKTSLTTQDYNLFLEEIDRLQMNIMEMQDMAYLGGQDKVETKCTELVGSPDDKTHDNKIQKLILCLNSNRTTSRNAMDKIQKSFAPYYKKTVIQMANSQQITIADLPQSILDRYSNKDRSQFLTTIFPSGSIWKDADFLKQFVEDTERISDRTTGMPSVFNTLISVIGSDGRKAIMLTIIVVFILLWLDFKKARHALLAMIPLVAGLVWMVGLMKLTGQQFTVMNVMGLPMILGIGIDDGVHIVHRWLAEGKTKLNVVFASTGKAILLTSLTTMLGFGSLIFSVWRGFGHLGAALFVGVAACFLTSVLFLAGILGKMRS